jgi:hypothetical protein
MPKYYGEISMAYATDNLKDIVELDKLINELVDTWQLAKETKGINWDDLSWSIHEEKENA